MQADLAILGSHGYSRFMRFLLGSVSELLVREAPASDLIVMGSKGLTGVDRYLLGSVPRRVARHASCSVLVVRRSVAKGESADDLA
jgi:nucleotide-binding universal stress UspA family protein